MTNQDLDLAKKWARDNIEGGYFHGGDRALAAARVIQSLPALLDQIVDGDKLREVVDKYKGNTFVGEIVQEFADLLPAPALPTLADMTPEERQACQWMQCKLANSDNGVYAIASVGETSVKVIAEDGFHFTWPNSKATPLTGEPKVKWPGSHADTVTAESVNDMQAGRIADFEPDLTPLCPEDVPAGEPWIVLYEHEKWVGVRASGLDEHVPWSIIRMNGLSYLDVSDSDITLVSRLVQEDKP